MKAHKCHSHLSLPHIPWCFTPGSRVLNTAIFNPPMKYYIRPKHRWHLPFLRTLFRDSGPGLPFVSHDEYDAQSSDQNVLRIFILYLVTYGDDVFLATIQVKTMK